MTSRRWVAALVLGALGAIAVAPSALAHALVRSSEPADGAQLDESPTMVSITFTEEPELAFSGIQVLDQSGTPIQRGSAQKVPGDPSTLRVGLPALPTGVYTVSWRVLSRVDGHATGGAFAFGVGVSPEDAVLPPTATPTDPAPRPLEVAGRWVLFVGLGLLVGAAWVGVAAFDAARPGTRVLLGIGLAAASGGLVALAEAQRRAAGAGYGALLDTPIGRALAGRLVGIVLAAIAVAVLARARGPARRAALLGAGFAAAGAMFVHVSAGHAGNGDLRWVKVVAQWVHVLAVGVWLGGLAVLIAGIRARPDPEKARAIRRFSAVAGVALVVVFGTGVARAVTELPAWSALWDSWYGRVVLIKTGLIAVLAALGGLNRYRYVPMSEGTLVGLRRTSRAELSVAGLTLIAAAALATLSPPADVSAVAAATAGPVVVTGTDFGRTVEVRLTVSPGFAGANEFTATLRDPSSGAALDAERVALIFTFAHDPSLGESTLELTPAGDGTYRADGGNLSLDGTWRIAALVQRAQDSAEIRLEVATRCRVQALEQPGLPTLFDAALAGGRTAQMYLDPGKTGFNEVHITYFDDQGNEMALARTPAFTGRLTGERAMAFQVRRLSAGHFVADAELTAGRWRFETDVAAAGARLRACFQQTVE